MRRRAREDSPHTTDLQHPLSPIHHNQKSGQKYNTLKCCTKYYVGHQNAEEM